MLILKFDEENKLISNWKDTDYDFFIYFIQKQ